MLTLDLKKDVWKTCDSPEMELRCRFCVLLGFTTFTVVSCGIPTLLYMCDMVGERGIGGRGGEGGKVRECYIILCTP